MASATTQIDLWSLVAGTPQVDPNDLLAGIESELKLEDLDFRTRLLLRDSYNALEQKWGQTRLHTAISPTARRRLQSILQEDLGPSGFATLPQRIMDATDSQTILRFLRELGEQVRVPARLDIGGSTSLILRGMLRRGTDDIDAVDEIPGPIRVQHELLASLASRYGLQLAHFQSHYLPDGWRERLQSLGRFGNLDVWLVSEWDILIGKLFSAREKDRDDLRMLFLKLAKDDALVQLKQTGTTLLAEPRLLANAQVNWRILFGEELPA